MSKGVLLFAFNSHRFNYYKMAVATAKRVNYFLNLPVTIVTDETSISDDPYVFDKLILAKPDYTNKREWGTWINKGRYQAFDLSPYDETILLDTDYLINSNKLLNIFNIYDDFACHDTTSFLMNPDAPQEIISNNSFKTLWATVVAFKKTKRAKQIFDSIQMIQNNYDHYSLLHGFIGGTYRNDYALSFALRIVNGHTENKKDIIPWNLIHIGKSTLAYKNNDDEFNSEYTIMFDNWKNSKIKKEYITVKDLDFHVLEKDNFMDLIK